MRFEQIRLLLDVNRVIESVKSRDSIIKESYEQAINQLEELERIATEYEANKHYIELGKAVAKAYKETYTLSADATYSRTRIYTIKDLIEWAEGRE